MDKAFEREKLCYEKNCNQFTSLNEQMNKVPVLAMTITGGLWFGAGFQADMPKAISFSMLLLVAVIDLALVFVSYRIRDVMSAYLEKMKEFHPGGFVPGTPKTPKLLGFGSYSMISVYCTLMLIAAGLSFVLAFCFFWPFRIDPVLAGFGTLIIGIGLVRLVVGHDSPVIAALRKEVGYTLATITGLQIHEGDSSLNYYRAKAKEYFEGTHDVDMSSLYEEFLDRIPDGGAILDAGSGSGRDSKAFQELGFQVSAFDASPELAELATSYSGVPTDVLRFQELDEKNVYDGIWACASLVHVPLEELPEALSRLRRALKPSGVLYMSFKEGDGERSTKDGRRFTDLTEEQVRDLVRRIRNLSTLKIWVTHGEGKFAGKSCWVNVLAQKTGDRCKAA